MATLVEDTDLKEVALHTTFLYLGVLGFGMIKKVQE